MAAYVWSGDWANEEVPSPKSHCQESGDPVEVSVNCTARPETGDAGLNVNDAANAEAIEILTVVVFDPEPSDTVNVTGKLPAPGYV